jgi:hypothetical protein
MSAVEEILNEARQQLEARKVKLMKLIEPAKAEVSEIDKALRKLGPARDTRDPGGAKPTATRAPTDRHPDKRAIVLRVLLREDPQRDGLSVAKIAGDGNLDGRGLHQLLAGLEREGLVGRVGRGFWRLISDGPVDEEEASPVSNGSAPVLPVR